MFVEPEFEAKPEAVPVEPVTATGAPTDQHELALAKVARWWPKGVERCDPEPTTVAFSRRIVAGAQPANPQQAGQALSFCFNYATWLLEKAVEVGADLDAAMILDEETIFSATAVGAYLDGPLANAPTGTRKPARSLLRCLEPGSRLPQLQRRHDAGGVTSTGGPAGDETEATPARPILSLSERIDLIVATHVPAKVDSTRFDAVVDLVRPAAASIKPSTEQRARNAINWCAYLAAWVDAGPNPLRTDYVFHPDTVETYLQLRLDSDAHERSIAAEASLLRRMSKTLLPTLRPRARVVIQRAAKDEPYSTTEVNSLLATAARLGTKKRARFAFAVIALGLSVGPHGGEYPWVAPSDIADATGQVVVALRRQGGPARFVVALPEYAHLVLEARRAAVEAGDEWLMGGKPTSKRLSGVFADIGATKWGLPLRQERLRSNFLVGLMLQAHTVPELLDQAGLNHLASLERLERFVLAAANRRSADHHGHHGHDHDDHHGHHGHHGHEEDEEQVEVDGEVEEQDEEHNQDEHHDLRVAS